MEVWLSLSPPTVTRLVGVTDLCKRLVLARASGVRPSVSGMTVEHEELELDGDFIRAPAFLVLVDITA